MDFVRICQKNGRKMRFFVRMVVCGENEGEISPQIFINFLIFMLMMMNACDEDLLICLIN